LLSGRRPVVDAGVMAEAKRTFVEFVLVSVVGLAVGLTANAVNGRGLSLGKDYFRDELRSQLREKNRAQHSSDTRPGQPDGHAGKAGPFDEGAALEAVAERLRELQLQPITHEETVEIYGDPLCAQGVYIFVDARDDELYGEGHIPGAYQLDHYRIEDYIGPVLEACRGAEKVVVYCHGGDCEDSELAALYLRDDCGLSPSILFVNVGGIEAWKKHDLEIEKGKRLSGEIVGGSGDE